jgi:predicted O-methyltransferase YrrM
MRSSYIENDYSNIFSTTVVAYRCTKIVELGILDGYSLIALAGGMRSMHMTYGVQGHIDAYDLFNDYQFKHGNMQEVKTKLEENCLNEYVSVFQGDAYQVHDKYKNEEINLLHVDISNTGETVRRIMELWHLKIAKGGIILFEGGSIERDNIKWMLKYKKESINPEVMTNRTIQDNYDVKIYEPFPSVTMLKKRHAHDR